MFSRGAACYGCMSGALKAAIIGDVRPLTGTSFDTRAWRPILQGVFRPLGPSPTVRRVTELCLAVAALMLLGHVHAQPTARAQPTDDSLRVYAVNIGTNYGIYLGKGLIITAAHVLGSESQPEHIVRIAGMDLPAKTIRQSPFELRDLALLSVDEQKLPIYLRMRRMPLCEKAPWVGEPVIVAIPEGTARSRIMSPSLLPPPYRTIFSTVIGDVATTGNS